MLSISERKQVVMQFLKVIFSINGLLMLPGVVDRGLKDMLQRMSETMSA